MPRGDATFGYRNPGIRKLPSSRYFFLTYEPLHLFAMAAASPDGALAVYAPHWRARWGDNKPSEDGMVSKIH